MSSIPHNRSGTPRRQSWQAEHRFCDFDLFTMQRNPIEYRRFCEWKHSLHSTAVLLDAGAVLDVKCNIMAHDGRYVAYSIVPWRSPKLSGLLPTLSHRCFQGIWRDLHVKYVLSYSTSIYFRCRSSSTLPIVRTLSSGSLPNEGFLDLNFADDMMRREEAVYNDRLRHLQGSMIPHCYGFHKVRV